jgi:hypothetical protein
MKNLFLRILFIPITFLFLVLISQSIFPLFRQIYLLEIIGERQALIMQFVGYFFLTFIVLWILTLLIAEILVFCKKIPTNSNLLKNLRFAPIAIYFIALFVVPITDFMAIQHSKYKIKNYVYSDTRSVKEPNVNLHNSYRGWCGNGHSSWINQTYFETASAGFNHKNPYVRAKSLLMASEVQDWLNGGDERFDNFLEKSCRDEDELVRKTADRYLNGSNSNCKIYLSK